MYSKSFPAPLPLHKIISGGQTGVDRGALDAAIACDFPCGGWCPESRKAEDGIISADYPLKELAGASYRERTLQNVLDSDGTVIIYFRNIFGGTKQTLRFCIDNNKPHILINAEVVSKIAACARISAFVQHHDITILNIAGPRNSNHPDAYRYTKAVLAKYFAKIHPNLSC